MIRKSTGNVWADPRKDGEPLWPERFSSDALHRMAKDETMSSHMAAGQLQQRPTARDGGLFKRVWFANPVKFVDRDQLRLVRAWDLAWTAEAKTNPDFSVGVLMGIDYRTRAIYVIDVIRERLSPANLERNIVATSSLDGEQCLIRIPRDPGAGAFVARYLASKLQGRSVYTEPEQKSKEARAAPFAAQCEIGMVKLLEGQWNQAPKSVFLELVLDHGLVALQPAHAERFHYLIGAVAGVDQDRPSAAENEHAEHRRAADAAAIASEHQEARFKLDVPVIENLDLQRHTVLPRSVLAAAGQSNSNFHRIMQIMKQHLRA